MSWKSKEQLGNGNFINLMSILNRGVNGKDTKHT